MHHIRNNS